MEGYLKLTFVSKSGDQYIEDLRAVKALENAGVLVKILQQDYKLNTSVNNK